MPRFIAIFTGQPGTTRPDAATEAKGIEAWGQWVARHQASIVDNGAPLGKTKRVSQGGVQDARNNIAAYTVVEAPDHDAAARMFEGHPHFTIFPGDGVDIMPLLAIPGS